MKVTRNGTTIRFTFDEAAALPAYEFDYTKAAQPMREYAEGHGWEQRLRDNAAIARKDKAGNVVTVTEAMRREAVTELGDHYLGGATEWAMKGGPRAAPQNPHILAIAAKFGITYQQAEAKVAEHFLAELSQ